MNNLTPYQKRLYRLLRTPNARLRFYYDGGGCEGYHFSVDYTENDIPRERQITEETFCALEEHCEVVNRHDQGRTSGYAYWYTCKPKDLVTNEERERMKNWP